MYMYTVCTCVCIYNVYIHVSLDPWILPFWGRDLPLDQDVRVESPLEVHLKRHRRSHGWEVFPWNIRLCYPLVN